MAAFLTNIYLKKKKSIYACTSMNVFEGRISNQSLNQE